MLKKPKLLYITHAIQIGGVEVALMSAIPTLYNQYDLTVIVLGKIDEKMTTHLNPGQKKCLHSFDYPLSKYPLAVIKVQSFIRKLRPDVMITSLWRASMMGVIAKKLNPDIKFISFVHSSTFFHRLDKYFTTSALRNSDHIFTDSSASSDFISTNFAPKSDISVISFFTQRSPLQRMNPPLTEKAVRFMFLGRLSQVKNLNLAVETIAYLRGKGIDAHLNLYGRDEGIWSGLSGQITSANLQGVIKYRGELHLEQKAEAFQEHHFLIQLSSNEGMAMSVAEAMQNGLVCFVTPVGEIRHYAEDTQTALFADIWNKDEWARSLEKLADCARDPLTYQQISQNSYNHFRSVQLYSDSLNASVSAIIGKSMQLA